MYVDRLTRLAHTYLRNWSASEDAVQEAFLKAYQSRTQLKNKQDPFPWLARIVVNQCRTTFRKTWREVITGFVPDHGTPAVEDTVVAKEQDSILHQCLMALPESLRTPLYLYYFEEMSTKEIAKVVATSDGAVRTRLNRGRDRLAKEVARREEVEYRRKAASDQGKTYRAHR